jgi:hypothetical protein
MAYRTLNPLVITIDHPAPAAVTATLTRPLIVVDAIGAVTTPAAVATSFRVSGPGGNITDAISLGNNADHALGRAGSISDANRLITAGANITSTLTGAGTAARSTIICIDGGS